MIDYANGPNMAPSALIINGRYQVPAEPIGQGGMGVVYKAYDTATKRHVALKTLKGVLNPAALELFSKEWNVLARLSHPNIVDIVDTGEFEEDGQLKPYFVMPYLRGQTLEYLIASASQRLTVERVVEIVLQTCRGLQAAHEEGLIHRDLKPSNIFVMDDDTVKIIDFGVVHLADTESLTGIKGTLQYMAPEQVEMKPLSAASDIFSLSVVCYEAFTGRKPFNRKNEAETADAIRRHIPPPVCELNPLVTQLLSRVVHKAMAKAPWHRFSTAREYAETMQKALNNQPIERFERGKIQPRIERAKKAQGEGDLQFASEVLTELEAEGHIDPEMTVLRIQLDHAIRQKSIRQLLDSARTRREEEEFPLALQKIQEVLEIDPENADALSLRRDIEKERSVSQIENWYRLVDQHIHNHSFDQARQALQEILKINSNEKKALELIVEVDRREQEIARLRTEKEQLYQSALSSYQNGEISSALSKLEKVLEVNRRSPDSAIPDRDAQYQGLYNQIRTERDAARNSYAEGRKHLTDRNFSKALEICAEFLKKTPGDPMFQALKLEAEEQERQEQSSFIAEIARRAEGEADLDRRVNIFKEAAERYPNEIHFQQSLRLTRDRRDLVNSIVTKARQYEERSQFGEALGQWDILRNIYSQYPGIEFEIERVMRRRDEQVRGEAKSRWVERIDRGIAGGDYVRASDLAHTALGEFPGDRELEGMERLARQALERAAEADVWLQRGQQLCFDRQFGEGLEALRKAAVLDNRNPVIRAALLNALVEQARSVLGHDWRAAEPLIQQALTLDASHPLAKSLQGLVLDYKRQEIVNESISQARELQVAGDLNAALEKVEAALLSFPNEIRLAQLRSTLRNLAGQPAPPLAVQPAPAEVAKQAVAPQVPEPRPVSPTATVPVARDAAPEEPSLSAVTLDNSLARTFPRAHNKEPVPAWLKPETGPASAAEPLPARLWKRVRSLSVPFRFSPWQWAAGAALPVLLLGAFIYPRPKPKAVAPADYAVNIDSNVPGAVYRIDGKATASFPVRLTPGRHKGEAFLTGYRAEPQIFNLAAPLSIVFHFEPEPVRIRLSSSLKSGQVSLDGEPPVDLQNGTFTSDDVSLSTEHKLTLLQSGMESLSFSFRAEPGDIAVLTGPAKAKEIDAIVVSNLGSRAKVYATNASLKGSIGSNPARPIPPDGLDLTDLPAGTLTLVDGNNTRPLPIEVSQVPVLNVLLATDPNIATLTIDSNIADADVTINGKKQHPLKTGKAQFLLAPGAYSVVLTKDGYQTTTKLVTLKKGEVQPLPHITMNPVVRTATLVVAGGTPGAEVWMDDRQIGTLGGDGSYSREGISPEPHVIGFKKAEFEDKDLPQKTFIAGQSVQISGNDARLAPFGALVFHVSPEDAGITYKRDDEAQGHRAGSGTTVRLKAGSYSVSATAPEHRPVTQTLVVPAGNSVTADLVLPATEAAKIIPDPVKEQVPVATAWAQHKGSGLASFGPGRQGTFAFEVRRPRGIIPGRPGRIDWVVDQTDANNRVDYSLEQKSIERRVTVNGKTVSSKHPVQMGPGETWPLRFEIQPDKIVVKSGATLLDEFQRPAPGAPPGESGFRGDVSWRVLPNAR
jgi:serine/threonine protein kinase